MNTFNHRFTRFLASLCVGMSLAMPVAADDTEIFFSDATLAGVDSVSPNILFVVDTSGSMSYTVSGTGKSRLENVKDAMVEILNSTSNVNIGLMSFHLGYGGPVRFPVANLEEDAGLVENGVASPNVDVRISAPEDDAVEDVTTTVVRLNDFVLPISQAACGVVVSSTPFSLSYTSTDTQDSMEQWSTTTNKPIISGDLDVGDPAVAVRYPSLVGIGQCATITAADITFTYYSTSNRGDNNDYTNIYAHAVGDSPALQTTSGYLTDMDRTTKTVPWTFEPVDTNFSTGDTTTTPDVASVMNEIITRSDWVDGNAMTFLFDASYQNADPRREFEPTSGDGDAPVLTVSGVNNTAVPGDAIVGLHFNDVGIPSEVDITSAYIEFVPLEDSSDNIDPTIYGELTGDAATFTTTNGDLSSRSRTVNEVTWKQTAAEPWTKDTPVQSEDISDILEEIVADSGWCGGQDINLFLEDAGGMRNVYSYDQDESFAPRLVVYYDTTSIPATGGCLNQTITEVIPESYGDVEVTSGGSTYKTSSDLDAGTDYIGLTFDSLNIPQGATILEADLTMTGRSCSGSCGSSDPVVAIQAHDAGDSGNISNASDYSSRSKTSASASWNMGSVWVNNQEYTSPDISSVIQEVVNRGDWDYGNNMTLFLDRDSSSNHREAYSYDSDPTKAPKLRIKVQGTVDSNYGIKSVRERLLEIVAELTYNGGTPMTDTMYEGAQYYAGNSVWFGKDREAPGYSHYSEYLSRVSHPATYTGGTAIRPSGCTDANLGAKVCNDEYVSGSPVYTSPIDTATAASCQSNYMVLLSDGSPNRFRSGTSGNTGDYGRLKNLLATAGDTCTYDYGGKDCAKQLARYMHEEDMNSSIPEEQNVTTYTIGFNLSSKEYMIDVASAGGGSFYEATDAGELASVFKEIVAEVLRENTSFVAPATTVNAFNSLTHNNQLYFALFKPSDDPQWVGNLKKYELADMDLTDGVTDFEIVDKNGVAAIDSATNFFKDTSESFWSSITDGPDVSKGGVIELLPSDRNAYTWIGTNSSIGSGGVAIATTANEIDETNSNITQVMVNAVDSTDRSNLLKWARGVDILDHDGDGNKTEANRYVGDPLHTRPLIVTYGGTPDDPLTTTVNEEVLDTTIFFTTNEGYLHAIDADDGTEQFAFMPQELLQNIEAYYRNTAASKPYGLDGEIAIWMNDVNNNGVIYDSFGNLETGEHIYLYFTMRRGGQNVYAMDVTDRDNPRLLWVAEGGVGDFAELGQTWGQPQPARVKFNGAEKIVLFINGGYDETQDDNAFPADDTVGRAIYMVDAETGDRLWWAGGSGSGADLVFPEMTNSIPGSLGVFDLSFNSIADRLYFADTRGQVWRIDIDEGNTGASDFADGGVLFELGDTTASTTDDEENNRRFYARPSVSLQSSDGVNKYLAIAIGTGFRAHPLSDKNKDRFYVLRDKYPFSAPPDYDTKYTESDLYDATDNVIDDFINSNDDVSLDAELTTLNAAEGYFIEMRNTDGSYEGEKVLSNALTFNGIVSFTTFSPVASTIPSNSCQASLGTARQYLMDINYGGVQTLIDDEVLPIGTTRTAEVAGGGIPPDPIVILSDNSGSASSGTPTSTDGDNGNCSSDNGDASCYSSVSTNIVSTMCVRGYCIPVGTNLGGGIVSWREN